MPEEPANSRTASGVQAHVSAEGKRIALKAGPEPLGLEPSAWARTNGATPELALGSCDPAVWKKSGPMLSRRAGEGGYKRFPPYCKRIVRRLLWHHSGYWSGGFWPLGKHNAETAMFLRALFLCLYFRDIDIDLEENQNSSFCVLTLRVGLSK